MALPTVQRTWTITPNNAITYVSLNDTMARFLFGVKQFLVANGYTVQGSSDGTTGAMDATDRWITFSNVTTRGGTAATPQSWIVLRDGNGVDILITYQGSADHTARVSFSPGQLYVAAGTPTHQPTATDEQLLSNSPFNMIGAETTNRRWNGWVDSVSKSCRFMMFSATSVVGHAWGVEEVDPASFGSGVSWTPPVWGFAIGNAANALPNGTSVGLAKVVVGSIMASGNWIQLGAENIGGSSTMYNWFGTVQPGLQGGAGYPIWPLIIGSNTAGRVGKLGKLYDWWIGRTGVAPGDTYGTLQFIHVNCAFGSFSTPAGIWPWDGTTTPLTT